MYSVHCDDLLCLHIVKNSTGLMNTSITSYIYIFYKKIMNQF